MEATLEKAEFIYVKTEKIYIPKFLRDRKIPKGLGMWGQVSVDVLDGKRLVERRVAPCRSFLRNTGLFMRNFLSVVTTANENLIDSTGVARNPRIISGALVFDTSTVVFTTGQMKFGSGTPTILSTDFDIQTPIASLPTATITTAIITENAAMNQWKHEGTSINSAVSPVTVNEIGLYAQIRDAIVPATGRQIMMLHDLTGAVIVGAGLTILGRYTITVSV